MDKELPVSTETLFPVGSVTKPLSSSLIGVYYGKSKFLLSDPPRKYVPYLQFSSDEMNNLITIEDLLTHRSGIGNVDACHVFFPTDDITRHLKRLSTLKSQSGVREKFDYSNMGYAILGEVISQVSGKSWGQNLQEEIFRPLEMNNTNWTLRDLKTSDNFSLGYGIYEGKPIKVDYEDQHESYASGAINSNVEDLSNWIIMLLNRGEYKGETIVPKGYVESSFSEHNIIRGSFSFDRKYDLIADTYGYGWFVHQYKNIYRVNHEGNVSGFTASVNLYPHKGIGIVILTNQDGANALTKSINDIIFNRLTGAERRPWKDYPIRIGNAIIPIQQASTLNSKQLPSHDLRDFCGSYQSAAYGELDVFLEGDQLMIGFPAFKMHLHHQGYNTFNNKMVEIHHQNAPSFHITFFPDHQNKIEYLTIDFSEEPEKFKKIR